MENQTTKKSTMIHKENEWECKFVGIWADMIKDNGLAEKLKGQNSSFSKTHNFEENSFLISCAL